MAKKIKLSAEEIERGFVNPVETEYTHSKCKGTTEIGPILAEAFAANPGFYGELFCSQCQKRFPVEEYIWKRSKREVGK